MKTRLLLLGWLIASINITLYAQDDSTKVENKFSVDFSADLVSRYVWRGMPLSASPALQPTFSATYGNFTLGSWASYTFAQEGIQEVDLFLSYESKFVSLTINDYFNPDETMSTGNYFNYNDTITGHTFEGVLGLSGSENFPIEFEAGVFFYGNDKNDKRANYYSTYFGLSYTAEINKVEIKPFIGVTPFKGYYASKLEVVNIGISANKNLSISEKFELPISASFIVNPNKEMVFLVFGITL
jgi:hypothetical protein